MNADEIVRALKNDAKWVKKISWANALTPGSAEFLAVSERITGAADLIESMQAQLTTSQRRADKAVEDLTFACGSQPSASDDASICDICKHKQPDGSCPKQCFMNSLGASNHWQWRGPQEGEGKRE